MHDPVCGESLGQGKTDTVNAVLVISIIAHNCINYRVHPPWQRTIAKVERVNHTGFLLVHSTCIATVFPPCQLLAQLRLVPPQTDHFQVFHDKDPTLFWVLNHLKIKK